MHFSRNISYYHLCLKHMLICLYILYKRKETQDIVQVHLNEYKSTFQEQILTFTEC